MPRAREEGFGHEPVRCLQDMNEKCPRGVIDVEAAKKAAQGGGKDGGCCVIS